MTCANIVGIFWYQKLSLAQFHKYWDYISAQDVQRCLEYCAEKQCVKEKVHSFCEHCTLDVHWAEQLTAENEQAIQDGLIRPNEPQENYWEFAAKLLKNGLGEKMTGWQF